MASSAAAPVVTARIVNLVLEVLPGGGEILLRRVMDLVGLAVEAVTATAASTVLLIYIHGCQMAIARFLERMCLALRASGLWLRCKI